MRGYVENHEYFGKLASIYVVAGPE